MTANQRLAALEELINALDHDEEDLVIEGTDGVSDHRNDGCGNLLYDARCFRCAAERILHS